MKWTVLSSNPIQLHYIYRNVRLLNFKYIGNNWIKNSYQLIIINVRNTPKIPWIQDN